MVSWKYILLSWFVKPLGFCLVLILVGLAVQRRQKKWGTGLALTGALLLYIFSTAPVSLALQQSLLVDSPREKSDILEASKDIQAIIVLGAGAGYSEGKVVVSEGSALRCQRAVLVHRLTGLPILLSSGNSAEGTTDAELMSDFLQEEFGVEAKWLEDKSQNTFEHSVLCRPILNEHGVTGIFLVTEAKHLRRAKACFEAQAIKVVGTPLAGPRVNAWSKGLASLTPRARALALSSDSIQEWLANLVYWVRY